jgi:flagellar protein FlbD
VPAESGSGSSGHSALRSFERPLRKGLEAFSQVEGDSVIIVTRLNGVAYWLNPHIIETIERKPDTTVTLQNGKKLVVKESTEELIEAIVKYRRQLGLPGNEE